MGIFIFVVCVFVFFVVAIAKSQSMIVKNTEKIGVERLATLQDLDDFTPTIEYMGSPASNGIAIDPNRRKLALIGGVEPPRIVPFDKLVGVEVIRDGKTITSTHSKHNFTGAAIGTALVGPLGMALGGSTKSVGRTQETINVLALKLYLADLNSPVAEVAFFHALIGAKPKSFPVTSAAKTMDEWYGRLRMILAEQEKGSAVA